MSLGFEGEFELLKRILANGKAEYFLAAPPATRQDLPSRVVLQRLLPEITGYEELLELWLRAAEQWSALIHLNIERIYEYHSTNASTFLITERLEGLDLRLLMRGFRTRGFLLPLDLFLQLALQMSEGLAVLHESFQKQPDLFVTHRSVLLCNFFLAQDGTLKLLNLLEEFINRYILSTTPGIIRGDLSCLSPRVIRGEAPDSRDDLFSLGGILYELATGNRPFQGESEFETLMLILRARPSPIAKYRQDLPEALSRVILRLLAPHPEEGYPDARTLQRDILELFRQAEISPSHRTLRPLIKEFVPLSEGAT